MADTATSYSPVALAKRALSLYARMARATIDTGWNAAAYGIGLSERVAMTLLGAATGGAQGALLLSRSLLQDLTPTPVKRLLPSTLLLEGSDGEGQTRGPQRRQADNGQEEAQVIGMGGGYTLNMASVEAIAETPSPQYTPRGTKRAAEGEGEGSRHWQQLEEQEYAEGERPEFIQKSEAGIGAAAPRAPQTPAGVQAAPLPAGGTGGRFAPYSPEGVGMTEAPHAYGERYVGQEVETLGSEAQGAEEPRLRPGAAAVAGGAAAVGAGMAVRHALPANMNRLDEHMRRAEELRNKTAAMLRQGELLPLPVGGEESYKASAAGVIPGERRAHSPVPLDTMPTDITGEEGRPLAPNLEALPEGQESMEPNEGLGFTGAGEEGEGAQPPGAPADARAGGAEARLRGMFAPAAAGAGVGAVAVAAAAGSRGMRAAEPAGAYPSAGGMAGAALTGTAAAPTGAAATAGGGYEIGSEALLGGKQGERVAVQRVGLPALGRSVELESATIAESKVAADVAAQQKQRILEGMGVAPAPLPAGGAPAGGTSAGGAQAGGAAAGLAAEPTTLSQGYPGEREGRAYGEAGAELEPAERLPAHQGDAARPEGRRGAAAAAGVAVPAGMAMGPAGVAGVTADREGMPSGQEGMPYGKAGREGVTAGREGMPSGREGMPARREGVAGGIEGVSAVREGMPGREGVPASREAGQISIDTGLATREAGQISIDTGLATREAGLAGREGKPAGRETGLAGSEGMSAGDATKLAAREGVSTDTGYERASTEGAATGREGSATDREGVATDREGESEVSSQGAARRELAAAEAMEGWPAAAGEQIGAALGATAVAATPAMATPKAAPAPPTQLGKDHVAEFSRIAVLGSGGEPATPARPTEAPVGAQAAPRGSAAVPAAAEIKPAAATTPVAGAAVPVGAPPVKKKGKGPWHKFKKEVKKVFTPPTTV